MKNVLLATTSFNGQTKSLESIDTDKFASSSGAMLQASCNPHLPSGALK